MSQILLNIESTFKIENVFVATIERLTNLKLFLSPKLNLKQRNTVDANQTLP